MNSVGEAKQIAEDFSRYLYFADNNNINETMITDVEKLNDYTTRGWASEGS